jgi:DNA-binding GntR family transcriptional regulator
MPKPHTPSRRLPARPSRPAGADSRGETLTGQAYQKLRHALMTGALLPE